MLLDWIGCWEGRKIGLVSNWAVACLGDYGCCYCADVLLVSFWFLHSVVEVLMTSYFVEAF